MLYMLCILYLRPLAEPRQVATIIAIEYLNHGHYNNSYNMYRFYALGVSSYWNSCNICIV